MTRNLKVLGVVGLATLALGAIVASTASAKGSFTAAEVPSTVTAAPEGAEELIGTTAGVWQCNAGVYDGTLAESPTTAITLIPSFNHCTANGVTPSIVDRNGCEYRFTIDPTSAETKGWMDIICPAGNEVTFTMNQNTAETSTVKCTIHYPPQTVGGIIYSNVTVEGRKNVTINFNATGMTYTHTKGSGLGACAGSATLQHNGTYKGSWMMSGESIPANNPVNIDIG